MNKFFDAPLFSSRKNARYNPSKSRFEKLACKTKGTASSSLIFFFSFFHTKPIEYYSIAATRAVFNLIPTHSTSARGGEGDESINMPGINQSEDRSPYFSWRNSVFEFLSRGQAESGRIRNTARARKGICIRRISVGNRYVVCRYPPQSRTETRVLREVYVN